MSSLVIVAIPEEQDRVWKISSEKVPRLTLLYLGDVDDVADVAGIMQFVQHATQLSEHGPFYLDVDRRGTLGEDEADVLFFSKRSWNLKWIKQFRGQLLQNSAVRTAYDSVDQFTAPQEWLPHLTLGYPGTPAKPLEQDGFNHPLYSVAFDRIAVWAGEYEGPEFQLEWPDREQYEGDLAVAWADEQKRALRHYGIKGMQWGKRKTETVTVPDFRKGELKTKKVTPKKAAKLDKRWEKEVASANTFISVHNDAANHVNARIGALNDKFEKAHPKEYNDGTLLNDNHPVTQAYHKEYIKTLKEGLDKSVSELSNSPTGKKRVKLVTENDHSLAEFGWEIRTEKVEHADTNEDVIVFVAKRDVHGKITNVKPKVSSEDTLEKAKVIHNIELGEEFIQHFGIKGMRWGVRNRSGAPTAVTPTATSKVPHGTKRKTKIKVEGGENHPAHDDAIKVAEAKSKLKKSGASALSNQELREVAERVRLEEQVKALTSSKGKKFVLRELENEGRQATREGVKKGVKKGAKAGKAAVTTAALLA